MEILETNDPSSRLRRIYSAINATEERDMSKFPSQIVSSEQAPGMSQDFSGGLSREDLSNTVNLLIHNIAHLPDHIHRWAAEKQLDKGNVRKIVDDAFNRSQPLKILKDLSNNDKHGYPSSKNHSRVNPRIHKIRRFLRMSTGEQQGSSCTLTFGADGSPQIKGGSAVAIITADLIGQDGSMVGDLNEIAIQAVNDAEQLLKQLGINI